MNADPAVPPEHAAAVLDVLKAAQAHRRSRPTSSRRFSPIPHKGDAPRFSKLAVAVAVTLRPPKRPPPRHPLEAQLERAFKAFVTGGGVPDPRYTQAPAHIVEASRNGR